MYAIPFLHILSTACRSALYLLKKTLLKFYTPDGVKEAKAMLYGPPMPVVWSTRAT
jgi:hypothetical protein